MADLWRVDLLLWIRNQEFIRRGLVLESRDYCYKAVLHVIGIDIQLAANRALQTHAGLTGSRYPTWFAEQMKSIFDNEDTHAALLVDATNAFNLVNRQVALHNISVLCPTILNNSFMVLLSNFSLLVRMNCLLLRVQHRGPPCYGNICMPLPLFHACIGIFGMHVVSARYFSDLVCR